MQFQLLMKSVVIYNSQYGNTEQIAEIVATALGELGEARLIEAHKATAADLRGCEVLALGGPTQRHSLDDTLDALLEGFEEGSLANVRVLTFDTRYDWPRWLTGSAATQLMERLAMLGATELMPAESFCVATTRGPLAAGELERAMCWAQRARHLARLTPAAAAA